MMKGKVLWVLVLFFISVSFQSATQKLVLRIHGLNNDKGHVLVSLFKGPEGFPDKPNKAIKKLQLEIKGKTASATISSLAPGDYAFAILHDENDDGKMNTNWVGWPKEGFGFSNNAMGVFGPPSFNKARFSYSGGEMKIEIKTKYY